MARFAVSAALLLSALTTTARAQPADSDDDTAALAAQAGVPKEDLDGALSTLHAAGINVGAREYLWPTPAPVFNVWDRLQSQCEAPGGWHTNTGNGYFGGLQEDMAFWRNYGGLAFAPRPDLATRAQQIIVAERGLTRQGWGAWPVCSRRLGLR